jgi:hypothetical protein
MRYTSRLLQGTGACGRFLLRWRKANPGALRARGTGSSTRTGTLKACGTKARRSKRVLPTGNPEAGQEEQIINALRYWSYYAVFGDGIYFVPDRGPAEEPKSFQLAFYEFSTRSIRTLARVDKWPGVGFSVSPDRRWVLFSPCDSHGADLMLVENFR